MSTYADPALSIPYGLDVDKPANPVEGSFYIATDTGIVYVCYTSGLWEEVTVAYDKLSLSGLEKSIFDLSSGTDIYHITATETNQANGAYSTIWKRFQGLKINYLPSGVNTIRVQFDYKLTQVDMGRYYFKVQNNGIDIPGAVVPEAYNTSYTASPVFDVPVQIGDLVQIYGYAKNKCTVYCKDLRILGTKLNMLSFDVSDP